MKCHYCNNESTKTLIWLKDKKQRPAKIKLPWCGCDLMTALRRIWRTPYQVVEGVDYQIEKPVDEKFLPRYVEHRKGIVAETVQYSKINIDLDADGRLLGVEFLDQD